MPKTSTKSAASNKKAASTKKKSSKEIKSEDHWSKRRSKTRDATKKFNQAAMDIDRGNIITGTRKRSNVNYRDVQLGREITAVKRTSKNKLESRQTAKIEKKRRGRAASKKSDSKKEE
jgi:hypothetical protein